MREHQDVLPIETPTRHLLHQIDPRRGPTGALGPARWVPLSWAFALTRPREADVAPLRGWWWCARGRPAAAWAMPERLSIIRVRVGAGAQDAERWTPAVGWLRTERVARWLQLGEDDLFEAVTPEDAHRVLRALGALDRATEPGEVDLTPPGR